MGALVEVHGAEEIDIAVSSGAEVIGINNRNLKDLSIDLNTTKELSSRLKKKLKKKDTVLVSESGVNSKEDLNFVLKYADAALIGTSLMKSGDVEDAVRGLVL